MSSSRASTSSDRKKEKRHRQDITQNNNLSGSDTSPAVSHENKKRRLNTLGGNSDFLGVSTASAIDRERIDRLNSPPTPRPSAAHPRSARVEETNTTATPRRKSFVVDDFDSLPDEYQNYVTKAGISVDEANSNLEVVLNILHFKTKYDFHTPAQLERKAKASFKRYNTGPSLISPTIVSIGDFEAEAKELFDGSQKKSHYKTILQAGKGGFGKVYLAKYSKDNNKVAVKRIPHITPKQKRKNFQEIRFLKFCKEHNNIVRYIRSFLVKDEVWLVTEYMQGGTLTQAVAVHKFTENEIAYISREVLVALDYLHDSKLAHRDLKSGNIMLDMSGAVKLIDFGLCSDISQGELVHMVGSPFWMPPEMIKREPHGLAADIWSFAICIMEVANGHPPNRKSSIRAMFQAGTLGYADPLESKRSQWSAGFDSFLRLCLQVDPTQRATVKNLLAHEWLKKASSKDHMKQLFSEVFLANRLQLDV